MAESAKGILRPLNLGSAPREGLSLTLMAETISKAPEFYRWDAEVVQPESFPLTVPSGSPASCSRDTDTVPGMKR